VDLIAEHAQQIANHPLKRTYGESRRTTKPYDRTNDAIGLDERACPAPVPAFGAGAVPGIERIMIQVGHTKSAALFGPTDARFAPFLASGLVCRRNPIDLNAGLYYYVCGTPRWATKRIS
jgi:hypothetical protein